MYVHRPLEEKQVRKMLAKRDPIAIAGPWQMGKSAFFEHVLRTMIPEFDAEHGAKSTILQVCIRDIVADCRDDEHFLWGILHSIGGPNLVAQEKTLPRELSKPARLRFLMKSELQRHDRIVLALEDAGMLAKMDSGVREWFISILKSCADTREPPWDKLQMLMELTTSPEVLDRDVVVSPWNVIPVKLSEFDLKQSVELAKLHELDWSERQIEERLSADFGGYPALLCAIMERARSADLLIEEFALGEPPEITPDHPVLPLLDRIYALAMTRPELLNLIYEFLKDGNLPDWASTNGIVFDTLIQRLLSTGLIKETLATSSKGRQLSLGCRAYEVYFRNRMSLNHFGYKKKGGQQ